MLKPFILILFFSPSTFVAPTPPPVSPLLKCLLLLPSKRLEKGKIASTPWTWEQNSDLYVLWTAVASHTLTLWNCWTCYQPASTYPTPHIYPVGVWLEKENIGKFTHIPNCYLPWGKLQLLSCFLYIPRSNAQGFQFFPHHCWHLSYVLIHFVLLCF